MPKESGIRSLACLKDIANMYVIQNGDNQDGKILRKFDGQKLELLCSPKPSINGESMASKFLNSHSSTLTLDTPINI